MDQEKLLTYCKEESEDHNKEFACKCIKHAVAELPYSFARDPKWEGRNRIGANAHCYDGGILFYQTRPKQFFFESEKCCKIGEAQITQIDCENILCFKKILKKIIGANRINSKGKKKEQEKHKSTKFYMVQKKFMSKFYSNKFGRICVDDRVPKSQIHTFLQTQRLEIARSTPSKSPCGFFILFFQIARGEKERCASSAVHTL